LLHCSLTKDSICLALPLSNGSSFFHFFSIFSQILPFFLPFFLRSFHFFFHFFSLYILCAEGANCYSHTVSYYCLLLLSYYSFTTLSIQSLTTLLQYPIHLAPLGGRGRARAFGANCHSIHSLIITLFSPINPNYIQKKQ